MRFCYCPACDRLRPYNWYARSKCENCDGECIVFKVKRSVFGVLMYAFSALAAILLLLHVSWYQMSWSWASFYSSLPSDVSIVLVFGLVFLSMAMNFVDLSRTTRFAQERVLKGIAKGK